MFILIFYVMKGVFRNHYYKSGNPVFVYLVNGTPAELEQYKRVQSANGFYREDSNPFLADGVTANPNYGKPLFFTPREQGQSVDLAITPNGRVVPNNPLQAMQESRDMQNMVRAERAKLIAIRQQITQGGANQAFTSSFTNVLPGAEELPDGAGLQHSGAGNTQGTQGPGQGSGNATE